MSAEVVIPEKKELVEAILKSYNQAVICPECNAVGITKVENKVGVPSAVTCCCCGGCWSCYRIWFHKDYNCWDANHTCSKCDKLIYEYKSC
jgi:hypothetical protein